MTAKDIVYEGDTCPECGEGTVVAQWHPVFWLECNNCGARWNDKGQRVACGDALAT